MKKTAIFVMLAITALLLVAGCNTQAQQGQQRDYYVPAANGCGVSGPVTNGVNVPLITETVSSNEFL